MAKNPLLKPGKRMAKEAGRELAKVALATAGLALSAYASKKVVGAKLNEKYHGPGLLAVGAGGAVVAQNEYLRALFLGVGAYGGLRTLTDFVIKEKKADFGLAGADASDAVFLDRAALERMIEQTADRPQLTAGADPVSEALIRATEFATVEGDHPDEVVDGDPNEVVDGNANDMPKPPLNGLENAESVSDTGLLGDAMAQARRVGM
jgi:hypothetical protein